LANQMSNPMATQQGMQAPSAPIGQPTPTNMGTMGQ